MFQGVGQCLIREYRMVCHVIQGKVNKDIFEVSAYSNNFLHIEGLIETETIQPVSFETEITTRDLSANFGIFLQTLGFFYIFLNKAVI
jgi:hypothetical protein